MNLQHVNIKLFVENEEAVDLEQLVVLFHGWVADQSTDELLIDVADYRHVPKEPSVVLVGHEADYSMDYLGGRLGLRYNCKIAREGDNQARLHQAVQAAVKAAARLEQEVADLSFVKDKFRLIINDRAVAPNTSETLQVCEAELVKFLKASFDETNATIEHHADPRQLFSVTVSLSKPLDPAALAS